MNKELEIAKENIKEYNRVGWIGDCVEHLESCKRFLEFIEEKVTWGESSIECFEDKVDDLQDAIKEYHDEEIKK